MLSLMHVSDEAPVCGALSMPSSLQVNGCNPAYTIPLHGRLCILTPVADPWRGSWIKTQAMLVLSNFHTATQTTDILGALRTHTHQTFSAPP